MQEDSGHACGSYCACEFEFPAGMETIAAGLQRDGKKIMRDSYENQDAFYCNAAILCLQRHR